MFDFQKLHFKSISLGRSSPKILCIHKIYSPFLKKLLIREMNLFNLPASFLGVANVGAPVVEVGAGAKEDSVD